MNPTAYREVLYSKYVSTFKKKIASYESEEIAAYWQWCDHAYYPLLAHLPKDAPILELACGPGFFLAYLMSKGFTNVTGVDVSAEQTAYAHEQQVSVVTGDALMYLSGSGASYQLIIAFDFFEHLTKNELVQLTGDIYNALENNGMLLIHTPNGDGFLPGRVVYGDLTHETILNKNSVIQLFSVSGFEETFVYEAGAVAKSFKSSLRLFAWKMLRFVLRVMKTIENGAPTDILTENLIAVGYKKPGIK